MFFGKVFSAGWGPSSDMILSVSGYYGEDRDPATFGGGFRARIRPCPEYRERYWAIFVNGLYLGRNYWIGATGDLEITLPVGHGNTLASLYVEDVGVQAEFDDETIQVLSMQARIFESQTANKIMLEWDNVGQYTLAPAVGDSGNQVSGVTITGARRNLNVDSIADLPCRGRLYYAVLDVAGVRIVRWYAGGNKLVAEGSRTGDGALTCEAVNGSELSIACAVAYTSGIKQGDAWLDLKWPARYEIHYATSALTLPRSPQDTLYDDGRNNFVWIGPALAAGAYNIGILAVDDEGDKAAALDVPDDSPLTLNAVPAGPTIDTVTYDSGAGELTVTITPGDVAASHNFYYSLVNEPINDGNLTQGPAPVSIASGVTTVVLPVAAWAVQDNTTDYDDLVSAWDVAVSTCNTAFAAGETGFAAAFATCLASLQAALDTYADALTLNLFDAKQDLVVSGSQVTDFVDGVAESALATAEWQTQTGLVYGGFLVSLGMALDSTPGRYTLPNGAAAGSLLGGEALGTGEGADGSTGATVSGGNESLYDVAQPFVKPSIIRICARAELAGIEDNQDATVEVELDGTEIVLPRPNQAFIQSLSLFGYTLTIVAGVVEDNAEAEADYIDLYATTGTIDPATPDASGTLPAGIANLKIVSINFTVGGNGNYSIAVIARSGSGATARRSTMYEVRTLNISNDAPAGAGNVRASAVRGKGS